MTLVETLIASGIVIAVTGAVLTTIGPAQRVFQAQQESSDMLQRLRVVTERLTGELVTAAAVMPHPLDDTITIVPVAGDDGVSLPARTYYLKSSTAQMMQYDSGGGDFPVIDHVTGLRFEYFGTPSVRRVRVRLTVRAASAQLRSSLPDQEIEFDVAPRNLNLDR